VPAETNSAWVSGSKRQVAALAGDAQTRAAATAAGARRKRCSVILREGHELG
jgi:hypothetical protein